MIHEVRLARQTRFYLWQIVHLQTDVLACAVKLSPGLTQADLQTGLETKMPSARARQVSEWIFDHKTPRETLQEFVKGTELDRQTLVDAMRVDILRLYWGHRNETLECQFDEDKKLSHYQKGAKDFLIAFYEQLDSGFAASLLVRNPYPHSKYQHRKYGREQFFAAYEQFNPLQYICAICDEHRPITILRGQYFSDIEHYFPKSVYPHLACHPYNLIPMCKACNSAHGSRDPLKPKEGSQRKLGEVFLPYRSESVRLQSVVKFDWNQPISPELSIEDRYASPNAAFRAKLEAFEEIYNIPTRWQGRIHQIGEQLWRQMSYYVQVEMGKGEKLDLFKAKTALERLLNYFIEDLGATPWDYVLIWYLSHLVVIEIESAMKTNKASEEVALLQALQDVIANQSSRYVPRLSVGEVLETSRRLYSPAKLP